MFFARAMIATLCCIAFAQDTYYAPDLPWNEQTQSHLGLVNPWQQPVNLVIEGFDASGQSLGTHELALGNLARNESAPSDWFGTELAWASIKADGAVVGYVRYEYGDGEFALVPLTHISGNQVLVSNFTDLDASLSNVKTALVNTSGEAGQVFSAPFFIDSRDESFNKEAPAAIPDFGAAGDHTYYDFSQNFDKTYAGYTWDTLVTEGDISIAAVQHLTNASGAKDAIALPRTSHRDMIVGAFQPLPTGSWSKLVLVNTYPTPLTVLVTGHYDLGKTYTDELVLDPFEKRVLTLNDHSQLLMPANANWYRLTPYEGGLIGFHMAGTEDGKTFVANQSLAQPSSRVLFPYVPNNETRTTQIGVVNAGDEDLFTFSVGLNDQGRIVKVGRRITLGPKGVGRYTMSELFSGDTSNISAVIVGANRGYMSAYALVSDTAGGAASLLPGINHSAKHGDAFFADFEHLTLDTLEGQGWQFHLINDPLRDIQRPTTGDVISKSGNSHVFWGDIRPAEVFTEMALVGHSGLFYMGYRPFLHGWTLDNPFERGEPREETAVFTSPFFEMPNYGSFYLKFYMRFLNPDLASRDSLYGMVYREEGSNTWQFYGWEGRILTNPVPRVRDCWFEILYRCEDAFCTPWYPMQIELPESFRGKRIQIGYFYHHVPEDEANQMALFYIDDVRIEPNAEQGWEIWDFGSNSRRTLEFSLEAEPEPEDAQ